MYLKLRFLKSLMDRPRIGLAVIVMKDDKVLLGKRKGSHGDGTWCFPGGHLEKYEEFADCALREVTEETGLDVNLIDEYPIAATNDFFPEDDKHYVTLYVRAKYIGGRPRIMEPERCEGWIWFSWYELPEPLFVAIENLIKQGYNPFANKK